MTVNNCIAYIDSIEPNAYTAAQKAMWISECEGKVYTDLFLLQPNEFTPVTYDADKDRTLALPAPYDRLYPRYLQAMIHYANGEYDRYANSMAAFNEVWGGLHRWFGANYDVSDRRRNRRVTVSVSADYNREHQIIQVPQGCALVGGRFIVRKAGTYNSFDYICPNALPAGTYNFIIEGDWGHFTTTAAYSAGTQVTLSVSISTPVIVSPPDDPGEQCLWSSGRDTDGTDLPVALEIPILFDETEITSVQPGLRGVVPIPMLIADREGADMKTDPGTGTSWKDDGEILFTARLLVPDEEFPFN